MDKVDIMDLQNIIILLILIMLIKYHQKLKQEENQFILIMKEEELKVDGNQGDLEEEKAIQEQCQNGWKMIQKK